MQKLSANNWKGLIVMLRKLVSGLLALALCASTLATLPRAARAAEPDPAPIVVIDPEDPIPPVEPGEPGEPEEPDGQLECASEFPPEGEPVVNE